MFVQKIIRKLSILSVCMVLATGCGQISQKKIIGKWQVEKTESVNQDKGNKEKDMRMISYIILFSEGSTPEFKENNKVALALGETGYTIKGNDLSIQAGQTEIVFKSKIEKDGSLILENEVAKVKLTKK